MKLIYPLLLLFIFTASVQKAFAQPVSCEYVLELRDSFGDGWNGATLVLTVNGQRTFYELNGVSDNGFFERIYIPIVNGDSVSVQYNPGLFEDEISWSFIDPSGLEIIGYDGIPPFEDTFEGELFCPACPIPDLGEIFVDDVSNDWVDISWIPKDSVEGTYFLEYGLEGFAPASGNGLFVQTRDNEIRIEGLSENTAYDVYFALQCDSGDESQIIGPISFQTIFGIDVGISDIVSPVSDCGLMGFDSVLVEISNFGGDPQTLIPFTYAIDGMNVGISFPTDGLYTGVLGKDSSDVAIFDQTFNFSTPGEYVISAWTDIEDDARIENDSFEFTLISIPTITTYPYFTGFEEWGSGWTIGEESENSSWEHGQPSGESIIAAATGQNAWVTNLDGDYNSLENSYLVSPCLDFSGLTEDPRISFSLFIDTEICCDRMWMESSVDGGESWRRVGGPNSGVNWYNDSVNLWWEGSGGFDGWGYAYNTLDSTAGFSDVRLRFVFDSDVNVNFDGAGIDNILIAAPFANDLAATSLSTTSTDVCGALTDSIILSLNNLGTSAIDNFTLVYQVDGGELVEETVSNISIEPNESLAYKFETPFNSSAQSFIELKAWVVVAGDEFNLNDTVSLNLSTLSSVPYKEDFETREIPLGWVTDGIVTDGHGSRSFVLSDALNSGDTAFSALTPLIGPIAATDSLVFDYRFVANTAGGDIGEGLDDGDSLVVQITTDCGESFQTLLNINATNHITSGRFTSRVIFLNEYAGENVRFRFVMTRAEGAFFVDIDNINITRCPASLGLELASSNEVGPNNANGTASVQAQDGVGPYTYLWSNGDTSKTTEKLTAGIYSVTVTDNFGCTDIGEILVGLTVDVEEVIPENIEKAFLAPNPTNGVTNLTLQLKEAKEVHVSIFSSFGQLLWEKEFDKVQAVNEEIDLTTYPSGLYFVRIQAEGEQLIRKLVR